MIFAIIKFVYCVSCEISREERGYYERLFAELPNCGIFWERRWGDGSGDGATASLFRYNRNGVLVNR
jgi:hypothetical protein